MRSRKSGKQRPACSPSQDKGREQTPPSDEPTWPRFDLSPPDYMIAGLRMWGEAVVKSGDLNNADFGVVQENVKRLSTAEGDLDALLCQINANCWN